MTGGGGLLSSFGSGGGLGFLQHPLAGVRGANGGRSREPLDAFIRGDESIATKVHTVIVSSESDRHSFRDFLEDFFYLSMLRNIS